MTYDLTLPKVVIDNGSGFIKAGVAGKNRNPIIIPNCIGQQRKRGCVYVADNCYTCSEYFCLRPQQSGIVTDPLRQLLIWEKVIGKKSNSLGISPEKVGLVITGPLLTPQASLRALSEIIFEDLGVPVAAFVPSQTGSQWSQFSKILKTDSFCPDTKPFNPPHSYTLLVDLGFSAMHSVPHKDGIPILKGSFRSNVGGNHLNAYLKNVISLRFLDLNFNELLVQHIKEESCYVSMDFEEECKLASMLKSKKLAYEYLIPEYVKNKSQMSKFFQSYRSNPKSLLDYDLNHLSQPQPNSFVNADVMQVDPNSQENLNYSAINGAESRDSLLKNHFTHPNQVNESSSQRIRLFAECFTVPEALFSPQIIGLNECGIVDLICKSLSKCPVEAQPLLAENIFICGGTAKTVGFKQRLYKELRASLPDHWNVCIRHSVDPQLSAYYGACVWALDPERFAAHAVTRAAFLEDGMPIR